jgi:hypothetical protein
VWLHILSGLAAAIALLSRENFGVRFAFAGGIGSTRVLGSTLPVIWPYIVSLVTSRKVVPSRRAYTAIYASLLLGSTIAGLWVILSVPDADLFSGVILVSVAQAAAYIFVADRIGDFDYKHRDV